MDFYNMIENLQNPKTLNEEVWIFHSKYVRQPSVLHARKKLESLKNDIQNEMNIISLFTCLELKHKGSVYEEVKIIQSVFDCPKFDLDFVIEGGEYLMAKELHPSWHVLKVKDRASYVPQIIRKTKKYGVLNPIKILELFYGSLSKCAFIKDYNINLRYHGPAVQMDVRNPHTGNLWFQVDLAPAFYLERYNPYDTCLECYVAKSPDGESFRNMWYRSYSTEECELMSEAGGTRKYVLRILKAMRANSIQFLGLQNYHFKMALFHVMEKFPNDCNWTSNKIGERLIDVLFYIKSCLDKGEMPNYFNKDLNIMKVNCNTRNNLGNLITRLVDNEQNMIIFMKNIGDTQIRSEMFPFYFMLGLLLGAVLGFLGRP